MRDAFRFMAQARHIGKVVVTHPAGGGQVRPDGAYLVTGGTGALGLAVAGWLVERGAPHVALVGRSAPTPAVSAAVAALQARGAAIQVIQADVSTESGVDAALGAVASSGAALRGVFHLAGVVDDGPVAQQPWPRAEAVLAPKATGAWLLDHRTRNAGLDQFVLFSSASGVLGAPGQGSYAAANGALDAVAHRRRALGLAGLSVDWGAWSGDGMAGRLTDRDQRRIAERGFTPLPVETALAALDRLLATGATRATVLAADWPSVAAGIGAVPSLLTDLATASEGTGVVDDARSLATALAEAEPRRRRDVLATHVRRQLARVLGLDPNESIDPFQGLTDLGMDSLMAVELSNRLSVVVRRPLASTFALEEPTLNHVVDHLGSLLSDEFEFEERPAPTAPDPDPELTALSEDELRDALLRELEATGY